MSLHDFVYYSGMTALSTVAGAVGIGVAIAAVAFPPVGIGLGVAIAGCGGFIFGKRHE